MGLFFKYIILFSLTMVGAQTLDERYHTYDEIIELLDSLSNVESCLLYTSPSPRDRQKSRMPSSA